MQRLRKIKGGLKPNKEGGVVHSYLDALIYQQKNHKKVCTLGHHVVKTGLYEGSWVVGYLITNKEQKPCHTIVLD